MKRLLYALLGLTLLSGPAHATLNLVPEADGTVTLMSTAFSDPVRAFSPCLGGVNLGVEFSPLSDTLVTKTVVSPITNALIKHFSTSMVRSGDTPSSAWRVTLFAGSQTTFPYGYISGTTNTLVPAVVRQDGSGTTVSRMISSITEMRASSLTAAMALSITGSRVMRGQPIFVQSQSSFTTAVDFGRVDIYLCPR